MDPPIQLVGVPSRIQSDDEDEQEMVPINFFDLFLMDQFHYVAGMTWFMAKYTSIFFLKLISRSGWMILNTGYRMMMRGLEILFPGNDNNMNHDDDVGEDWDFGDVEHMQPNQF